MELQEEAYLEPQQLQLGCLDLIPSLLFLQLVQQACLEQPLTQDLELKRNLHLALELLVHQVVCLVSLNHSPLKPTHYSGNQQHKQRHQLGQVCLGGRLLGAQLVVLGVLVGPLLVLQ